MEDRDGLACALVGVLVFQVLNEQTRLGPHDPYCVGDGCYPATISKGWPLTDWSRLDEPALPQYADQHDSIAKAIVDRAIGGVLGTLLGGMLLISFERADREASRDPHSIDAPSSS